MSLFFRGLLDVGLRKAAFVQRRSVTTPSVLMFRRKRDSIFKGKNSADFLALSHFLVKEQEENGSD